MTRRTRAIAIALAVLPLAACGGGDPLAASSSSGASGTSGAAGTSAAGSLVVGSANFPESVVLMNIYAGALKAKGLSVTTKPSIGAREVYLPAMRKGEVDVMPEYTGVLDQFVNKATTATTSDTIYADLKKSLPAELTVLAKSTAEDKDSIVVTKDTATKYKLESMADLAAVGSQLVLGGPPEWKTRPSGVPGLQKTYGVTFKDFRGLDVAGPLSVQALKNGQVQAVNLFTTDPAVAANGFVVLADPKGFFGAQNVVPLVATAKVTPQLTGALDAVSAKLDTASLAGLVKKVVVDHADADAVAAEWLSSKGLG